MSQRYRAVVVQSVKGKLFVPFIGFDAQKADAAYEKAGEDPDNDRVELLIYPTASRVRRPAHEADQLAENKSRSEAAAKTAAEAENAAAIARLLAAQKELEEATLAHEQLSPAKPEK